MVETLPRPALVCALFALLVGCGTPSAPKPETGVAQAATVSSAAPTASSGKGVVPTLGFNKKALREHDDYSEMVIIRGKLSDGGSLYGRLRITNVGPADQDADFRLSIKPKSGEPVSIKYKREDDEWSHAKSGFEVDLKGAKVTLTAQGITVVTSKGGQKAELKISTKVPPMQPVGPNDLIKGDQINAATLVVPHGTFTATAVDKGGASRTFTGAAYVEHRLSTIVPYRLAKGFHTVLDLQADSVVSAWGVRLTKDHGGKIKGWLLVMREGQPMIYDPNATFSPSDVRKDGKTEYGVPHQLTVSGKGHTLALTSPDGPKRMDDLRSLNGLQRLVVERLTQPWSFKFDDTPYRLTAGGDGPIKQGKARYIYQQLN